ncbi:MAG TPA: hypothetical protein VG488_04000, partial [Candidatus Angelobacter sp.]|nr:hypothetical protein [Candidatus Angelobacter sp.]
MIFRWLLSRIQPRTLFIVLVLVSTGLWAQAGDGDEDGPVIPTSNLTVHYNHKGEADVSFFADQDIKDWAPLQVSLENSLHCATGTLRHPESYKYPARYLDKL